MDSLGAALSRLAKEYKRPSVGIGAAVALGYALQTLSPLRLNNDNVRLLDMANNFLLGRGFEGSYMPSGYPAFVVGLDQIGMATPFGMVFANVLLFAVGLYLVYQIVRRVEPDVPGLPAAIVPTIALAIWVRSIGIMLLAAAAVAIIVAWTGRPDVFSGVTNGRRRHTWYIAAAGLVCAVIAAFAVAKLGAPVYVSQFDARDHFFESSALAGHAAAKATVVFQVLFNVPGRLIDSVPSLLAVCGGGVGLVLIALGFYVDRRRSNAFAAYALATVCLLLVWPYYQPRYWFPVLPFLFLVLIRGRAFCRGLPLSKACCLSGSAGFLP